jgi:predicted dehydrogenase
MHGQFGIGIIGLGRRWRQRYRPALAALRDRFRVRAVCDHLHERAVCEAKQLGCAAAGPTELFDRSDVDAVLLLGGQWYGLWPLELACRLGKPVLCAASLAGDDAHADALVEQVRQARTAIMMALAPRFAPAERALRRVLDKELGPARLVVCEAQAPWKRPARPGSAATSRLLGAQGPALVDWCTRLAGEARAVLTAATERRDLVSLFLECNEGRAVQIVCRHAPSARGRLSVEVVAERGTATLCLPGRLHWSTGAIAHEQIIRGGTRLGRAILEQFARVLAGEVSDWPGFEDAYRALRLLRAAERSRAEGRRVSLAAPT